METFIKKIVAEKVKPKPKREMDPDIITAYVVLREIQRRKESSEWMRDYEYVEGADE